MKRTTYRPEINEVKTQSQARQTLQIVCSELSFMSTFGLASHLLMKQNSIK